MHIAIFTVGIDFNKKSNTARRTWSKRKHHSRNKNDVKKHNLIQISSTFKNTPIYNFPSHKISTQFPVIILYYYEFVFITSFIIRRHDKRNAKQENQTPASSQKKKNMLRKLEYRLKYEYNIGSSQSSLLYQILSSPTWLIHVIIVLSNSSASVYLFLLTKFILYKRTQTHKYTLFYILNLYCKFIFKKNVSTVCIKLYFSQLSILGGAGGGGGVTISI